MLQLLLDNGVHDSEARALSMLNTPPAVILNVIAITMQLYSVSCTCRQETCDEQDKQSCQKRQESIRRMYALGFVRVL